MVGALSGDVRAEPNLTPLLDVVFQLITFFMLVFHFNDENYDQSIHLPVAGSAKPVEGKVSDDLLILNIDSDGYLIWGGKRLGVEQARQEIDIEADVRRRSAEAAGKKLKPDDPLPTTVVIRSDRATPFSQLYRIITACQTRHFTKFALKAMNAEAQETGP